MSNTKITTSKINGVYTTENLRGIVFTLGRDWENDWIIKRDGSNCQFGWDTYFSTKRDALAALAGFVDGNFACHNDADAPLRKADCVRWDSCAEGWNSGRNASLRHYEARAARRAAAIAERGNVEEAPVVVEPAPVVPRGHTVVPTEDFPCTCENVHRDNPTCSASFSEGTLAARAALRNAPRVAPVVAVVPEPAPAPEVDSAPESTDDAIHAANTKRARIAFAFLASQLHADGISFAEIATGLGVSPGALEVLASEETPQDFAPPVLIGVSLNSDEAADALEALLASC